MWAKIAVAEAWLATPYLVPAMAQKPRAEFGSIRLHSTTTTCYRMIECG